jgi:hypothetical protein
MGDRRKLAEPLYGRFLDGVDCRFKPGLILRAKYEALVNDLGGFDHLSYVKLSLVQRYLHIEAMIESNETAMVEGDKGTMTHAEHLQAVNCMIGIGKVIGVNRVAKPVRSLADYIEENK